MSRRLDTGWEFHKGDLGGVWEVWRSELAAYKVSHDVQWQSVHMPHCWNAFDAADPDSEYYQGPGWYRTQIAISNPYPNGRSMLRFQGAGQEAKVYVGLEEVGEHVGGYDEFAIDITGALSRKGIGPGQTAYLSVRCSNARDLERMPSDLSDFFVYGGLYRFVELVYLPEASLAQPRIHSELKPGGAALVRIEGELYDPTNRASTVNAKARVTDSEGNVVFEQEISMEPWVEWNGLFKFEIERPRLWSPDTPHLYTCAWTFDAGSGVQRGSARFGIRSFRFEKDGPFYLNGERLLLRGTHRHEDHAGFGAAVREDLLREEFRLMKDMGVNFIRLGHYQQSRQTLELCDEFGLLVWEEIPWCRGGVSGEAYREQGRRMLKNMISQHFNHPSVIMWGLGNEQDWPGDTPVYRKDEVRAYMAELHALAKELDPRRVTTIRRCDFARDIVDVYSPSIWAGWYRGVYTDYKKNSEEQAARVDRFIHAEWGGSSHAGRHSESPDQGLDQIARGGGDERAGDYLLTGGEARVSKDSDWSETYICNLFDWCLKEQETMPRLTGAAQWAFKDFGTPLRPENPVPYMNQKGLVQRDLRPKEAYFVFQSYWSEKPMARIYGHSWTTRWGETGERKMVKGYSNCDRAELYLNGKSLGVRTRDSQNFPAAGLRWITAFKEGKNQLKLVAWKGDQEVVDTLEFHYQVGAWGEAAKLEIEELSREGNRVRVGIRVVDADGKLCCDSKAYLRFAVAGEGELVENMGVADQSKLVQAGNGQAVATVDLAGECVLSVASDGLPGALFPLQR